MKRIITLLVLISITACTEPGKTTAYGAAAGGVVGAGLGAIIGNQIGSPGAGIAIGMATGIGAGSAIGNAVEAHDKQLAANEERFNRQEAMLRAQRSELESLRKVDRDTSTSSYNSYQNSSIKSDSLREQKDQGDNAGVRYASVADIEIARAELNKPSVISSKSMASLAPSAINNVDRQGRKYSETKNSEAVSYNQSGTLKEKDIITETKPLLPNSSQVKTVDLNSTNTASLATSEVTNEQCISASEEIDKSSKVSDSADKLFHIRRALRLCPNNAQYHSSLADLYQSMNRVDDAKFEYKEALRLDPTYSAASRALQTLENAAPAKKSITSSLKTDRY